MSYISPLSPKQKVVWSMINNGLSTSEVAERLNSTIQYVYQTKRNAEAKLSRALMEAAESNSIKIRRLSVDKGILLGYHPGLNLEAVVTYTSQKGIKVWYWYEDPEEVTDDAFLSETREYLLSLADERHLDITEKQRGEHPARLANMIFSRLIPEVRP